jgi:hypothetical protein
MFSAKATIHFTILTRQTVHKTTQHTFADFKMSYAESKTPNEIEDIPTRLAKAMEFLNENPDEKPITATRIYKLPPSSLYSAIDRAGSTGSHGGHNKILMAHHEMAIREFAMSLLSHEIQPTPQLIFQAIIDLKRAQMQSTVTLLVYKMV